MRNNEESIGIDLSIEALKLLKKFRFRGQLIHADSLHLPFIDKSFDAAFSNQLIEHMLTSDEIEDFISEMQRLSNRVLILTPNSAYRRKIHDPSHFFFFATHSLKSMIPNFRIFATNPPYDKTLAYYLLYESPKLRQAPFIGKFIVNTLRKIDSSKMFVWLNKKLWPGDTLAAIET